MPQRNQAVAFADPGYDSAAPNPPPTRTTVWFGQRGDSAVDRQLNLLRDAVDQPDPIAEARKIVAARQIAAYVRRLQTESAFEPLRLQLSEAQQKLEEAMREQSRLHNLRDRMQTVSTQAQIELGRLQNAAERRVPVATATKKVSLTVLTFCVFSLLIYKLTGLVIVHPFFATLLAFASLIFFAIGALMAREDRGGNGIA